MIGWQKVGGDIFADRLVLFPPWLGGIQQRLRLNWATCSLLMQADHPAVTLRRTGKKGDRNREKVTFMKFIVNLWQRYRFGGIQWCLLALRVNSKVLFTAMGLFTAKTLLVLFFTSLPQRCSYATQKWYRVQSSLRNLSSLTFAGELKIMLKITAKHKL